MESNNAEPLIRAAKEYGSVDILVVDGKSVASVPSGRTLASFKKYLDEYLPQPERKKGTAKLTTLGSFIAHVNRHKDGNSVIFADDNAQKPALLAVYDYNESGPTGGARWGEHRAVYDFPVSDEWRAWQVSKSWLAMDAFAAFLEERILDVMLPQDTADQKLGDGIKEFAVNLGITLATPQRLMELSRGLQINVGSTVVQAINIGSGEGQIQFTEEHKGTDGAPIRIPGGFAIAIPVFRGGASYQIPVRLRYRVEKGSVVWNMSLQRVEACFADAIVEAAEQAAKETETPSMYGKPE